MVFGRDLSLFFHEAEIRYREFINDIKSSRRLSEKSERVKVVLTFYDLKNVARLSRSFRR